MKFGDTPLSKARGAILAHSIRIGARTFKKGVVLKSSRVRVHPGESPIGKPNPPSTSSDHGGKTKTRQGFRTQKMASCDGDYPRKSSRAVDPNECAFVRASVTFCMCHNKIAAFLHMFRGYCR